MLIRNFLRLFAINLIVFSAILFHATATFAQHPCDNFPVVTCNIPSSFSQWSLQDNNTIATQQAGEPSYFVNRHSLWYSWTAPQNGMYVVNTRFTNPNNTVLFDSVIYIFSGGNTFASLTQLRYNDDWSGGSDCFNSLIPEAVRGTEDTHSSCAILPFTAGTKYYFQVDGYDGAVGAFYLNVVPVSPTAATSSISGRLTSTSGRGLSRATISLTDSTGNTRTAISNQFGYYRFDEVESGQNYVLQAQRKGYQFENNPRVLNVNEDLTGEDFTGANPFIQRE